MRIVSLLPSATEIVCALGLEAQLVGVSHECDWPPAVRHLPRITRTFISHDANSCDIDALVRRQLHTQQALYTLDLPLLESLCADLIVTQALCDVCAVADDEVQAASLSLSTRPRVVNLAPRSLADVLDCLRLVADATGVAERGERVIADLRSRVDAVATRSATIRSRPRVVLLEWLAPPFSCGHWTPQLVDLAGGVELLGRAGQRSRTLHWSEINAAQPEAIFVACCGFDVARTQQDLQAVEAMTEWQGLEAVRNERVFVIDGSQYFSRPGPRLVDSLEILAHTLHPDIHGLPAHLPRAVGSRLHASSKRSSSAMAFVTPTSVSPQPPD